MSNLRQHRLVEQMGRRNAHGWPLPGLPPWILHSAIQRGATTMTIAITIALTLYAVGVVVLSMIFAGQVADAFRRRESYCLIMPLAILLWPLTPLWFLAAYTM